MRVIAAGSVAVLVVLGVFAARPAPVTDVDARACDFLAGWAGPGRESGSVVIVEIDETSLEQFGRWPWPRDLLGRLSRNILDQGARVVALDMMFPQKDGGNDERLAADIAGRLVVAGYALKFGGGGASSPACSVRSLPLAVAGPEGALDTAFFHATGGVCSAPVVAQAAADNGFLNAVPDHDSVMRRIPLIVEAGGRYYPSLALAAVNLFQPAAKLQLIASSREGWRLRRDSRWIAMEERSSLRLRFRGGRRHMPYVSAADVLSAHPPEGLLRGKIAVVGGSAAGVESPFLTPVDALFPDVEIQATAIDNLLQGDAFHRPGDAMFWELALALAAGMASTVLLARLRSHWAAVATVGLAAGVWACCAWMLAARGTLISPVPASATLACVLPLLTLIINLEEKQKAEQTSRQLAAATQQSREVIRESESRYQRLVENVNDAIIMDDIHGRLMFANRHFRDLFGLHEADIRNVMLEQYVAAEWCAEVRDRHDRRMRGEAVADRFEFEGLRSNGTRIWIEALVTPVEEDGQIVGSQAALRDTTERKRMEERYLQAQKMESVGRLAGGVAHDFNNLLTVINGYSSLLLGQVEPGQRFRRELEAIQKAGEQAAELTQKLLAFSRKQLVKPRPLDLNVVVAEAEKMFERVIGEDIELITRLSPDLGPVTADPGQIHQVLMNLVVNARDAMPSGGKVTVETKNVDTESGPYVYLGVEDTGTGMTDEVKRHIFEPFFTTKDQGKGTGLGLATVYGIVHQSGGRIEVASELGRGATFRIYLPRIQAGGPEQAVDAVGAPDLRGWETVLVVEDQDAVRQFACNILESYGYRVLQAANGPDALALAEQHSAVIHLLITDIILPLMDGRVLADKLRAVRAATKVLYISGYSEERIGHSRELDNDLVYLPKPFTSKALAERVRNVLASS